MKIERVIIRKLRALRERDDSLLGPDGLLQSVCLRGLNGSGKTTYLEGLAQLWRWFHHCVQARSFVDRARHLHERGEDALLWEAEVFAVLFTDLPGPRSRLWIATGELPALRTLLERDPDSAYTFDERSVRWDPGVLEWWDAARARAQATGEPLANFVWIEAENKYVPPLKRGELTRPNPLLPYAPVTRYRAGSLSFGHLEGQMRTLFLARPERWLILSREVARLRPGLTLLDRFDEATQRPLFRLKGGEIVTLDRLSAGERSVLLNLCLVLRWLGPGGILLLDEPELHLHLSLMRGSMAVLEALVDEEFQGQIIVASHAPEVWDHFRASNALLDLDT